MLDSQDDDRHKYLAELKLATSYEKQYYQKLVEKPGMTGTLPFMAIGALDGDPHSFMHDLESFFWVLFWICIHYTRPGKETQDIGEFKDWNYESTEKLAQLKSDLVSEEERINKQMSVFVTDYCKDLIPCVEELWKIIFPGGKRWKAENHSLYSQMKAVIEKARDNIIKEEVV